jgi:hypothetical protein
MKLLKVSRALFYTGVNVAHNVRTHIDIDKHKDVVKALWLEPSCGLFIEEHSGVKHFIPNANMPAGCILDSETDFTELEGRKPGRPKSLDHIE